MIADPRHFTTVTPRPLPAVSLVAPPVNAWDPIEIDWQPVKSDGEAPVANCPAPRIRLIATSKRTPQLRSETNSYAGPGGGSLSLALQRNAGFLCWERTASRSAGARVRYFARAARRQRPIPV